MAEMFNFNAPQFVDFTSTNIETEMNEVVEAYFEIDHEGEERISSTHVEGGHHEVDNFFTPIGPKHGDSNTEYSFQNNMKKFTSLENISLLKGPVECISSTMENLHLTANAGMRVVTAKKSTNGRTNLVRKYCSASQESINKLSQNKKQPSVKYVSMAESIARLQNGTPERFRMKPKVYAKLTRTIPQSPALSTKARSRPLLCLNREEQEEIEINEMKKHKFKANPVDPKVLAGPSNVMPAIKPATVLESFNSTGVQPKKSQPLNKEYQFHARPVPKAMKVPPANYKPIQVPKEKVQPVKTPSLPEAYKPKKTILKPFSFDSRNKDMVKKKEEYVQQILNEEKKQRVFFARPLPSTYVGSSTSSLKSATSKDSINQEVPQFKARPAKVLQRSPFIAKKEERILVPDDFQLNTERRAKEREEYNEKLRENEADLKEMKKMREAQRLMQEEEEVLRLRKQCEYKAQPIRQFKQIEPVVSKPLTEPVTPRVARRKLENKENINLNGSKQVF